MTQQPAPWRMRLNAWLARRGWRDARLIDTQERPVPNPPIAVPDTDAHMIVWDYDDGTRSTAYMFRRSLLVTYPEGRKLYAGQVLLHHEVLDRLGKQAVSVIDLELANVIARAHRDTEREMGLVD